VKVGESKKNKKVKVGGNFLSSVYGIHGITQSDKRKLNKSPL